MILFTAPIDFSEQVLDEYYQYFGENNIIFNPLHIMRPSDIRIWVCNPLGGRISDYELERFNSLEILATPSTGINHIDQDALARRKIKLLSLTDDRAGLETISASSEYTFLMLLQALRMGPVPNELRDKVVGTIGFGRIGKNIHRYCNVFNVGAMKVYDPYVLPLRNASDQALVVDNIFKTCDAVVICCAYTPETHHMVNDRLLRSMKKGAVLVNTSRGDIIDEEALLATLVDRPDLRVALDVVEGDIYGYDLKRVGKLKKAGVIITDHVAGKTIESRTKAARIILNLIKKELSV